MEQFFFDENSRSVGLNIQGKQNCMSRRKITARYEGFSSIGDTDYINEIVFHGQNLSANDFRRKKVLD